MNPGFRGSAERGSSGYNIGRPIMSHGHGQHFNTEKERLSVFDRLGSRGGVSSGGGGSGANYSDFPTKGRRQLSSSITPVRRPPPEGERMPHQSSRYEQDKYAAYERTSRTRSKSPGYKNRMEHFPPDQEARRHVERQGHKEGLKSKDKEARKSKRKGHSSSKSKKTAKRERKTEVSSSDSRSKSGTSSTSKSGSSSSSASDASDSNSDYSSSESSAPSIKLKTGKSKGTGEAQSGSKEKRAKDVKKAIGSSSSSIVSTSTKHEDYKSRGNERRDSPYMREKEREYPKDRDYDRRGNLPPKTRDYPYPGSIEHEKERSQYPRHSAVDMPGRKRQNSVESYGSAGKRSRRYTPTPENYKSSGRHSPGQRRIASPETLHEKKRYAPEPPRRITPPGGYADKMRRERTPPPSAQERIRIIGSGSKPSHYEDTHRREDRYDDRPRDNRGRQFSPGYGNAPYDSKERRPPRERLAPARSSPARGRPPPEQNFDPPGAGRRAPLLPFPPGVEAQPQRFGYQQGAQAQHRDFPGSPGHRRGNPDVPVRKQGPPLSRAKDFERGGRQSMVDSWVDETIVKDPNRPALLPTPTCAPYTHPPAVRTEVTPGRARVGKIIPTTPVRPASSENKAESGPTDTLEEVLSDFSDDAEDLLSEVPSGTEKPRDESSETAPTDKDGSGEAEAMVKTEIKDTEEPATGKSANDVDMLDEFDLEEISDDELGDAERKAGIVDALGVDWSSLVDTQKIKNESQTEVVVEGAKKLRLRERWCPANRFKSSGLPRALFGEQFFNKIHDEIQALEEKDGVKPEERTTREELEYPSLRLKRLGRSEFLRNIGVMSSHTAYTRQRDEGLRQFLLHRPQVPVGDFLEFPQTSVEEDEETDLDIFQKSVALLKETMVNC